MNPFARTLGYLLGVACWIFLSVPRFDVERRRSRRYRRKVAITKNIWIGSGCLMVVLIEAFPANGLSLSLALSLLTTFLCFMVLDETE